MRVRMILLQENIDFDIFEISLREKPSKMLKLSPKGTVPILVTSDLVIDESLEIMNWAFNQNKKSSFNNLTNEEKAHAYKLINLNDGEFKEALDHYKYHVRFPEKTKDLWKEDCIFFIDILENNLSKTNFLINNKLTFADIAVFPFIRQFSNVDLEAFKDLGYKKTQDWLYSLINSNLFKKIMVKP